MKARVKATEEIIEVKEGAQIIFKDGSIGLGFRTDNGEILNDYQLDFEDLTQEKSDVKEKSLPKDEPDYWDKLHHQVAIDFMKSFLDKYDGTVNIESLLSNAIKLATALVNKLKEEEK